MLVARFALNAIVVFAKFGTEGRKSTASFNNRFLLEFFCSSLAGVPDVPEQAVEQSGASDLETLVT